MHDMTITPHPAPRPPLPPRNPPIKRFARRVSELKVEFSSIDFDAVTDEEDVYWDALGSKRETDEAMAGRARELFAWLRARPETNIAVVRKL